MNKKRLSRMFACTPRAELLQMAEQIVLAHRVRLVRPASRTLVQIKMREPVAGAGFYLGELLACEAQVEVNDVVGCAVMQGEDLERVQAAAVLDAAFNAGCPECSAFVPAFLAHEAQHKQETQRAYALHAQTQVRFDVMEDIP